MDMTGNEASIRAGDKATVDIGGTASAEGKGVGWGYDKSLMRARWLKRQHSLVV